MMVRAGGGVPRGLVLLTAACATLRLDEYSVEAVDVGSEENAARPDGGRTRGDAAVRDSTRVGTGRWATPTPTRRVRRLHRLPSRARHADSPP
jgi:hypothetical protein